MIERVTKRALAHFNPFDLDKNVTTRLIAYRDAISPNFVPWMTNVWVRCKSDVARQVCQSNLRCEIDEDHPRMLERYVAQAYDIDSSPQLAASRRLLSLAPTIDIITALTKRSALEGLLILAALEHASHAFIPVMRHWGEQLGFHDFEYVDKHGIADIKHATEMRDAVLAEVASAEKGPFHNFLLVNSFLTIVQYEPHQPSGHPALEYVSDLLGIIFAPTV